MTPVLLQIMPAKPTVYHPGFSSFWCSPPGSMDLAIESVIRLPADGIAPLCQALLAVETLSVVTPRTPLVITTTTELPPELFRSQSLPTFAHAWLSALDEGVLYFPVAAGFNRSARQAIRGWNPSAGSVTLEAVWQQMRLIDFNI